MPPNERGEVTIICLTDTAQLKDLGIHLTRGARAKVTLSAATNSRDLTKAKMDGTVSTQTLRASVIRTQEMVSSDTVTSQSPRAVPPSSVDLSPLLGALQVLTNEVKALRADLARRPVAAPMDLAPLLAQLRGLTVAVPQGGNAASVGNDPPTEEMFIPSNITGDGLVSSLDVPTHSSEDPGVSNAARALKTARKKR